VSKQLFITFPLLLLVLLSSSTALQGQKVVLLEDSPVRDLMDTWIQSNRVESVISGWRVQVLASTDREQVETAKTRFLTRYPDVPADWVHEKPYYKLRVGAFANRLEARSFIVFIQDNFPGAYPAKDPQIPAIDFLRMRQ
jgi:hypothetical protein